MSRITLPNGNTIETTVERMAHPYGGMTHTTDDAVRIDERGYVWLKADVFGLADNTYGQTGYHSIYRPLNPAYSPDTPAHIAQVVRAVYDAEKVLQQVEAEERSKATIAWADAEAERVAALPESVKALARKYGSAQQAWAAEDEQAWAILSANGY